MSKEHLKKKFFFGGHRNVVVYPQKALTIFVPIIYQFKKNRIHKYLQKTLYIIRLLFFISINGCDLLS